MKREDVKIEKLRYNPFNPDIVKILEEEYGEFDFGSGIDKNKACIYLILFYDLKSDFIQRYPDVIERRKRCAEIAVFPINTNKTFPKDYEDIMIGENENFNQVAYQYIKSFGSPEYIALHIFWKVFGNEFINAAKNVDSKTYKDTIKNTRDILEDIKKLTNELFSGEESLNMRTALYKGMEKDIKLPKPEAIAMAENVDELLVNPYGEYKPEHLKYVGHK